MKNLTARHIPYFALLLSGGLLCGAWFFEYVLNYAPCTMCYWQRDAHKVVIGIAVAAIILMQMDKKKPGLYPARAFAFILGLALLGCVFVAFRHAGVEYGWWEGPQSCAAGGGAISAPPTDPVEFEKWLNAAEPPACSDSPWPNSPISMAGLNGLISLLGVAVCFLAARRGDHV